MKINCHVHQIITLEVDEPVFERVKCAHTEIDGYATEEDYEEALEIIEAMTGLPFNVEGTPETPCIFSVTTTDDDVPILETC